MTGSIQSKDNRKNYYAVLNIYDESGKRKPKWVDTGVPIAGNNKRLAKKKLVEILAEYDKDGIDVTKDTDFVSFLENWLETWRLSISPTTYDTYRMTMNAHIKPYFEKKKLKVANVTPAVIQKYVNDKLKGGLSANTVRKHLANISKCLDTAVKQNIIAHNPVKRIEMPKKITYTGARHYNEKQIEQLLDCSKNDPLAIPIRLTLFYGLRRSEVLGLRWDAVDLENRTIAIKHTVVTIGTVTHRQDRTKNDSSYATFPIPESLVLELKSWKERQQEFKKLQPNDYHDEGYICTKPDGKLISPNYVSQHFALLLKNSNMPHIRFHDLRHSSASYLKALGFDLKDIQTWLRHKDIQTTM
ncbi:MAG: site-specific integrase, partial [Defluviitaleaceae bacterium]|nr:site-specific integrase [Defluviitaleaceae bacterium]